MYTTENILVNFKWAIDIPIILLNVMAYVTCGGVMSKRKREIERLIMNTNCVIEQNPRQIIKH